jgi:UDP-N-acetylmuramoyl-L-alanyl-D-glutamate--2,6-diaminopimelate ligase
MMRLEAVLEFSGLRLLARGWEPVRSLEVGGVAYDSRRVRPGDLFVAVRGERADGHDFVAAAAAAGAAAALVEHPVEAPLPQVSVPDTRCALGPVAAALHGFPGERLFTVGVTGTNGKTTTTQLTRHLLAEAGGTSVGLVGTVSYLVGGCEEDAPHTTPESADLQALLARMLDAGDAAVVLEVSSHGLALGRLEGLNFDVACFTNLGRDHLDFHGTMEAYLAAKRILFERHRKVGGTAVVNIDDPEGGRLARDIREPVVRVGLGSEAQVRASEVMVDNTGVSFTLHAGGEQARLASPLLGLFNVHNLLTAAAVGQVAGYGAEEIARVLAGAPAVPGRMERLPAPQGITILLDYAHKPEALRGALQACRELAGEGRVLVVFGCGGDRDRGKRPLMGRIAALGADRVFVTSDNPRTEDPEAIIAEIVAGIPAEARGAVTVEKDRPGAIAAAVAVALPGDVLLVAGKGHERYQIVGTERRPFDERAIVAEAVAAAATTAAGGAGGGRAAGRSRREQQR